MHADSAETVLRDAIEGRKSRKSRGSRRAAHVIAADVIADEYAAIVEHARVGGYESLAEYARAVCLAPKAIYDTDQARIAKPLADVSYRVARARDALQRGDLTAVAAHIEEIRVTVSEALRPLSRTHERTVRKHGTPQ